MKDSQFEKTVDEFAAMEPTPRRGVLDELKKANVILLIASGLSRREAAGFVQCAHTTIGRTAARDPDFADKLTQAEATAHVQTVAAIRGAMRDPKYWRAAAWMLERRSPEEYARRDPNTFTADHVMSLLARLYSESLPLLSAEKVQAFQELFDEALDEVEAKSVGKGEGATEKNRQRTHLAPRDGFAAEANGCAAAAPSGNGHHRTNPVRNGHHRPDPAPSAGAESSSGKANAGQVGKGKPLAEREEYVRPLAEREERDASREESDVNKLLTADRFAPRAATRGNVVRRLDRAQLHQPHQQGVANATENGRPKAFDVNDLHHQSTSCTTPGETEGRCNKAGDKSELAGAT
jgi:hypothetical protein